MTTFSELGIGKRLCASITEMGWTEPTPIQVQAVPEGMSGKDMFGQAQTGTGKTGAYSMIALGRTRAGSDIPTTLVLTPTRELAEQVSKEMKQLSANTRHRIVAVYGGASIPDQIRKLEMGCDVVVGTPGRILDLNRRGNLRFDAVKELIIDEADRMLDMGFMEDMETIISLAPENRQTLMFSATLSDEVRSIAERSMKDPIEVSVSQDELVSDLVRQYYVEVKRNGKMDILRDIMANGDPKMVVFCSTKKMVDDLYSGLSEEGLKVGALHGDMPQLRRDRTIRGFKNDRMNMLIATDVAARGLDIDDISYVINYDMPDDIDTYIHRIGRTGRAGKEGTAVSFVTSEEEHLVREFEMRTGMEIEKRDVPDAEPGTKDTIRRVVDYDQISDVFGMCRFEINLGKNDGFGKVGLADFIIRNARIRDVSIGKITVGPESSVVEVHKDFGNRMTMDLTKAKFKNKRIQVRVIQD